MALVALTDHALAPPARQASSPDSILRFIPPNAAFVATGRSFDEILRALDRTNAWPTMARVPGLGGEVDPASESRRLIGNYLDLHDDSHVREALGMEFGLVAPAWSRLGDAVWLLRVPDESVLDRWYPTRQRRGDGAVLGLRFFHLESGVLVCVRDGVAAISRRWGPGSLFERTMRLMAAQAHEALAPSAALRSLTTYMPANPLAMIYLVVDDSPVASTERSTPWWPSVERAAIAVFEDQGRIDLAVRAKLRTPHSKPALDRAVLNRLLQLPQTSLFAWATTLDFGEAYDAASGSGPASGMSRYLTFLAALRTARGERLVPWPSFGPHVIVCWGQDLTEHGAVPQIAAMIECQDAPAVRSLSLRLVENTTQLIRALDPTVEPTALAVKETRHLGLPILSVSFRSVADKSRLPAMKLLANVELSWVVADGWLTIALTREHLEAILDAQQGLISTLAAVPDVRAAAQRGTTRTVFAAVQPDLATEVLRHWLEAHRSGELSLLDPAWWEPPDLAAAALRQRGFATEEAAALGMVVVTEVDPKGAAAGKLLEGDWILGVDGVLLALRTPSADFETRWAASKSKLGPMLRVQREEQALDVIIPSVPPAGPSRRTEPARLISELITLGRTLQFVSFEAHAVDEMNYSARVSVRFAPDRISNAGSSP